MATMNPHKLVFAVCMSLLLVVACGDDDDDDDDNGVDAATIDGAIGGIDALASPDSAPLCGPPELCMRTINECGIALTQPQCEGWYADPAQHNCADIGSYTTCNCNCITQPDCDTYFACGMTCFEDNC